MTRHSVLIIANSIAAIAATAISAPAPQAPSERTAALERPPLWSMQPVRRPVVPHSKYDLLAANPIDRFLFARLEAEGLKPSPPATKRELLRRASIDLTGLPPTPDEVAAFLADRSPTAYEKVVDRLLASPAYGERWGRHWLDVVRYGESNGYEQNYIRPNAWPYRDWVIRSLNDDMPYDRFVREQIAGDGAATGFLVAGVHDTVGIQEEQGTRQQRSNDLDDIVATTGATFLGLTVGCARCHDHKFDPISQLDYYRMTAVFSGVHHGERRLRPATDAEKAEAESLSRQLTAANDAINEIDRIAREVVLRKRGVATAARPAVNARRNVDEFPPVHARFVRFTVQATRDGAEPCLDELQVFGPLPNPPTMKEMWNHALASRGGKATASSLLPGFAIHQIEHLNDGLFGNDHSWISATRGTGWAQIELPREETINRVVWSRDGGEIPRFDDRLPVRYRIEVSLDGQAWQTVSTDAGRGSSSDYVHPDELAGALTAEQKQQRAALVNERDSLKRRLGEIEAAAMVYGGTFGPLEPTYLLRRGDVMQRLEQVQPGALAAIPLPFQSAIEPGGPRTASIENPKSRIENERGARRTLANWITDPANPLTARVIVNRVWQHHFGRGIVGTPSDLGRNGEPPSHPELLDWLAAELVSPLPPEGGGYHVSAAAESTPGQQWKSPNSRAFGSGYPTSANQVSSPFRGQGGWSLKKLHRLIATSYAYRQSSAPNPAGMAKDAGNRLLWRAPLQRMEAEAVRDSILAVSGKLDRRAGGPGYRLFDYKIVNVAIYGPLEVQGPETWRRAVYSIPVRSNREELMETFDCPECSQREPRRPSTTTALQALILLNGRFTLDQAAYFADRVRSEAGADPAAQVRRAFTLAFGRPPSPAEAKSAAALTARSGLTSLCRALYNANEFLYY